MVMLEDFRLRVFVTVAEQSSFSKAALKLKISQPSVSNHIIELEKQLNVKLFDRQYGVTLLTPAGEVLRKHAEKILADYREIESMYSSLPGRVVKISASEEVYDHIINTLLADFITLHPEIVFVKSFPDDADLTVSLLPDNNKRGMLALSYHPSVSFAATRLWSLLSDILTQ